MKQQASRFYLPGWIGLGMLITLLAACGGGDSSGPDFTVDQYEGSVSLTGNLNDSPLNQVLAAAFPGMGNLSGSPTSQPLFLVNPQQPLTEDTIAAVLAAKANNLPIAMFNVTPEQVNAVLALVDEPANYALPDGLDEAIKTVEIFAIDFEEDGMVSTWDSFTPARLKNNVDGVVWEDSNAFRARRVNLFIEWMTADGDRSALLKTGQKNAQQAISAQAGDNNLINLSPAYMTIRNFAYRNDLFQITHNVWTCHSFSEADGVDYDWGYVEQGLQLRSGNDYKRSVGHKYFFWQSPFGNDYDIVENYVNDYWTYSAFDDYAESKNFVRLLDSSPKNVSNVATITEGISYNFGGSIGFIGKAVTGSVSAGVTISNSKTYEVSDSTIENQSMTPNIGHDARWQFRFALPKGARKPHIPAVYFTLTDSPLLARSLFQPSASWLWRIDPRQRDVESRFHTQFGVNYGRAEADQDKSGYPAQYYYPSGGNWWGYRVNYKNPPLIVSPTDIDFNSHGSYKTIDLSVARNWTASCDQPWCYVTPTSGTRANTRLNVTVDPNATGGDRTATVTAKTA
ncbi:MAG: leukocidin family pore-forming toxin, partial [Burkholderiales bacterium]|nr:leukocidin family pore-forming toxin [Burkholderiales bacterium]